MGGVDIGTEWNLKLMSTGMMINPTTVDIGTEWNLKITPTSYLHHADELI